MIIGSHTITNIRSNIIIPFRNLSVEYIYRANSKHAVLLKTSDKFRKIQLYKMKGDKLLSHAIQVTSEADILVAFGQISVMVAVISE